MVIWPSIILLIWKTLISVGAEEIGCPGQNPVVFVDILRREFADVVRKRESQSWYSDGAGPMDNSFGFQTAHDAIINAEIVGLCMLRYVKSKNLLFVFGQSVKMLNALALELPLAEFDCQPPIGFYGGICNPGNRG